MNLPFAVHKLVCVGRLAIAPTDISTVKIYRFVYLVLILSRGLHIGISLKLNFRVFLFVRRHPTKQLILLTATPNR